MITDQELGDRAVDLLRELVAIDSVNPGLVPGAAGETEIVEHLRNRLTRSGWRTTVVPALGEPNRPSLLAHPAGMAPDSRPIVLNGHLDTVGVSGMAEPFTARIEGRRLYARGACDMLGGVAAMVVAAEAAATADVVLALMADEEDRSLGSEAVLAALPQLGIAPSACLVGEPTWLGTCLSLRGYAIAEVRFAGRASHTSLAGEGINALTHAAAFVGLLEAHANTVRDHGGELLASVLAAGRAPFTVPDQARVTIERRTTPGEDPHVILEDAATILDALRQSHPEASAQVSLTIARPAWELATDGPARAFADRLAAAIAERMEPAPEPIEAPYWMESALWEAAGIPSLVCGPAGGGLHAVDEWVDLDQVRAYAAALAAVLSSELPSGAA